MRYIDSVSLRIVDILASERLALANFPTEVTDLDFPLIVFRVGGHALGEVMWLIGVYEQPAECIFLWGL